QAGVVGVHRLCRPAIARVERGHEQPADRELPAVVLVAAARVLLVEQLERVLEVHAGLEMAALARRLLARQRRELERTAPLPGAREVERENVGALGEPAAEARLGGRGDAPVQLLPPLERQPLVYGVAQQAVPEAQAAGGPLRLLDHQPELV